MALSLTIRRLLSIQPIDLPVFHPIALKLQHLLADHNFTIDEVANTANEDQALAGQILKLAISSSYRGRVRVETIRDALIRLGAHQVSNLAMAASQAGLHVSENSMVNEVMRSLWFHSHACALGCRWVAENAGYRSLADRAYLAGLASVAAGWSSLGAGGLAGIAADAARSRRSRRLIGRLRGHGAGSAAGGPGALTQGSRRTAGAGVGQLVDAGYGDHITGVGSGGAGPAAALSIGRRGATRHGAADLDLLTDMALQLAAVTLDLEGLAGLIG